MNERPSWRQRLRSAGLPVRPTTDADRREVEQSGLFDAAWYVAHAPDATCSGADPLDHYLTVGGRAGHSPGPHFDSAWYLRRYNDVAAAQLDPLLHFIRRGQSEGRRRQAPAATLFDDFQSLGIDCEFGLVQRHFGSEPLDLFRFCTTPLRGLIALLETGDDPFESVDALELVVSRMGECKALLHPYGFEFHTSVAGTLLPSDRVKDHEVGRLRFLWRKFREDLEDGGRIFVCKARRARSDKPMKRLARLLGRGAPNHLLWVTVADGARTAGTVEMTAPRLMHAFIDRFHAHPAHCSYDVWERICRRAHGLAVGQT